MKRDLYQNVFFIFLLLILQLIVISCDIPRDRRINARVSKADYTPTTGAATSTSATPSTSSTGTSSSGTDSIKASGPQGQVGEGGQNISNGSNSTNSGVVASLGTEFNHCSLNPPQYNFRHPLIGDFNICLSNLAKSTSLVFQAKQSITDYRLCFFPTSQTSDGGAEMIGEANCLFVTADKIHEMKLAINRKDFTNRTLNGVMIIKDMPYGEVIPYYQTANVTYPMAYQSCMLYLYQTGDTLACQRFKAKQQYVNISFTLIK